MSGVRIHPRCDATRSTAETGQKGKTVFKNIPSLDLPTLGRRSGGRASTRFCACSDSAYYDSSDVERSGDTPKFSAPFSTLRSLSPASSPSSSSGGGRRKRSPQRLRRKWWFGRVLDPQTKSIKRINRMFLLSCTLGMFVDPLFLSSLAVDDRLSCLYVNGAYAAVVATLRAMVDGMYLWHMWLQLKLAYVSRKSLVLGSGELVRDARSVALHYLCAFGGFGFDVFVILPIPQLMLFVAVPHALRGGEVTTVMTYSLVAFLVQYIPKVFHLMLIIRRMQRVTGYVFGTASWGFGLNVVCYLIAAHVAGSCWYLFGIQRVENCMQSQCGNTTACTPAFVACPRALALPGTQPITEMALTWGQSPDAQFCFNGDSTFEWGIFAWVAPLVKGTNGLQKIVYPLFWGIMTLSSFGNALSPSNQLVESTFCVIVVTCGLLLFTMLIGNIQVFLHSYTSTKESMQLKMRDLEWWMRRRQLPSSVRQRVRQSERQKWAATRGVDETAIISELPEGLRRDIRRHLCVDLVRRVPLFDQMDDLVVNNICERLKPLLFIKGETIVREGDPVLQMVFVVRGFVQSEYRMTNGNVSSCVLGPGNFSGDELVPWFYRRLPPSEKFSTFNGTVTTLPTSNATLTTLSNVEIFGFEARDIMYITEHFRNKFANEKLRHTARYWSSNWRTWAAVTVQLAWRRFKAQRDERQEQERTEPRANRPFLPALDTRPARNSLNINDNERLRLYTAMFCSPKPQDQ